MAKTTSRSKKASPALPQIDGVFLHILSAAALAAGLSVLLSVELYAPDFQILGWLGDDAGYGAIEMNHLVNIAVILAFALSLGRLVGEGLHRLLEWPVIGLLGAVFLWRMLTGGSFEISEEDIVMSAPVIPVFWVAMGALVALVLFGHVRAVREETAATRVFAIGALVASLGGVLLGLWVMAKRDFGMEDSMAMHGVRLLVLIPPIMAMVFRCRFPTSRRFAMWVTGVFLFFILLAGLAAFDLGRLGVQAGYFDYEPDYGPALQLLAMGQFWVAAHVMILLAKYAVQRVRMERAAEAARAARPKRAAPTKRAAPVKAKTGEKSARDESGA